MNTFSFSWYVAEDAAMLLLCWWKGEEGAAGVLGAKLLLEPSI